MQQLFKVGQLVDVQGVTIGKDSPRDQAPSFPLPGRKPRQLHLAQDPGSTGQNQSPARVFPASACQGIGDVRRTISNLEIVRIDAEQLRRRGPCQAQADGMS